MSKSDSLSDNLSLSSNELELPESDFYEDIINIKEDNKNFDTTNTVNFIKLTPAEQLELTRIYRKSNIIIKVKKNKNYTI